MKNRKRELRFDTPKSHYSVFRESLIEILASDTSFKAEYLAREFESKLLDPEYSDTAEVRRQRAIEKWLASEVLNQSTNMRLMFHSDEDFLFLDGRGFPVCGTELLGTARRIISETIGETIPWTDLRGSFSGGASTSMRRGLGMVARKYQEGSDITESAIRHFLRLSKSDVWAPRDFNLVGGNVMFTVPKTSLIDRCACKEPDYNMYIQKAIGDYIRRRLRMSGIDLNDQTRNQELARRGSLYNDLATIDLSSASDSVTVQLVMLLLPTEWFDFMDDVRSPVTYIDGQPHENAMFSSMGNAFTFELESLIFWALARACAYLTQTRGTISVYGDDIICPSGLRDSLLPTLEYCGFRTNLKKTFFEGPFRESCGKHWYSGREVTPFYVKKVPSNVSDWCHLLNSLRRWTVDMSIGMCDPTYFDLWAVFADLIPEPVKGHWDLSLRSNLCCPGRKPIARLMSKQLTDRAVERRLQFGFYLQWLNTTEDREQPTTIETSVVSFDGPLVMSRLARLEPRDIPTFPQEHAPLPEKFQLVTGVN